ncbi:hypothetical protein ACFY8O_02625 [Streptomyces argenteolus]|uniref:Small CPxCG-related zinc finger protein n=1 Tax=Streptomyces argenteolus TaxID=67274 RepID=A0ABW6WYX8_9ACTN
MDEETDQPGDPGSGRMRCARCGTTAEGEGPPPTWLCSVENGTRQYFCDACARAHIRSIESRLDADWW